MNQPIKNKIPIKNAGPEMINDQENMYHSNWGFINKRKIYNNPTIIKAIPPTHSYFQEINKITNKRKDGILWRNSAKIVCQKLSPIPKTSKEKRAKKQINIIDKILGVQ
ncbi:MAG: hypothetical protein NUV97_04210 [archaeon]|nr:hypothetical protein [archaeon]